MNILLKQIVAYTFLLLSTSIIFTACSSSGNASSEDGYHGEKFEEVKSAMNVQQMQNAVNRNGGLAEVVVKGEVDAVCKKKGCWMTIKNGNGDPMRVTFKDYGFFVPKDIAGKDVVFKGNAYFDTTSVEMLRHYAEDEGLAQAEIDKITKPEVAVAFEATGVFIEEE